MGHDAAQPADAYHRLGQDRTGPTGGTGRAYPAQPPAMVPDPPGRPGPRCRLSHYSGSETNAKNPDTLVSGFPNGCLAVTYFHMAAATLSSARLRFTAEFG